MAGKASKRKAKTAKSSADSMVEKAVNRLWGRRPERPPNRTTVHSVSGSDLVMRALSNAPIQPYLRRRPLGADTEDIRVEGCEAVFVIPSSSASTTYGFGLNPALAQVFPRLSGIASSFQEFEFEYLELMYRPTCPTTQAGQVIVGYMEDPTQPIPSSELDLANFAVAQASAAWAPVATRVEHESGDSPYYVGGDVTEFPERHLQGVAFINTRGGPTAAQNGILYMRYAIKLKHMRPVAASSLVMKAVNQDVSAGVSRWNFTDVAEQAGAWGWEIGKELLNAVPVNQLIPWQPVSDEVVSDTIKDLAETMVSFFAEYTASSPEVDSPNDDCKSWAEAEVTYGPPNRCTYMRLRRYHPVRAEFDCTFDSNLSYEGLVAHLRDRGSDLFVLYDEATNTRTRLHAADILPPAEPSQRRVSRTWRLTMHPLSQMAPATDTINTHVRLRNAAGVVLSSLCQLALPLVLPGTFEASCSTIVDSVLAGTLPLVEYVNADTETSGTLNVLMDNGLLSVVNLGSQRARVDTAAAFVQ